ncbi:MAG: NAD(P)/FAD-dependent oxidoreductase [Acidobacteriota bacterium]
MRDSDGALRAVVVGAGPAGLACAALLREAGVEAQVLERADQVGDTWRRHYERLRLHTVRWLSHLPGWPIPREYGAWVSRADFVAYLEEYARRNRLRIEHGTAVTGIAERSGRWRLETSRGALEAEHVVVATGLNRTPAMPPWPGRAGYRGELLHAAEYRNAAPYRNRDVLVVGAGNSGAEIALDLLEGGARRVRVAVRRPPNILRREIAGIPTQAMASLLRPLPPALKDSCLALFQRMTVGGLERFGLPRPARGVYTQVVREHSIPIVDTGFVAAVRQGRIAIVPAVRDLQGEEVLLEDGSRLRPEATVAATGYRPGLEELLGGLGVLSPDGRPPADGLRGLHFIGFTNSIEGNLRRIGSEARRIARSIGRNGASGRR